MKKFILAVLGMLMCFLCLSAFASETESTKYQNTIRIAGETKEDDFITVMLVDKTATEETLKNENIKYIEQVECDNNGKFSLMFTYGESIEGLKLMVRAENTPAEVKINESSVLSDLVEVATRTLTKDGNLIVINKIENFFGIKNITYHIVAAFYDAENRLISSECSVDKELNLTENSSVFKTAVPEGAAQQKVYVWTNSMIPVSGAVVQQSGNPAFNNFESEEVVVALIGDSLTQHNYGLGSYKLSYQHYYMTRYPNKKVIFVNKGIGGNSAPNAVARVDWDIMDCEGKKPDAALIMLGMNDAPTFLYENDKEAAEKTCEEAYERFTSNIENLVEKLLERGVETTLMSSTLFDHGNAAVLTGTDFAKEIDGKIYRRNDEMARYAEYMKGLAEEKNLNYIPMNEITTELTEKIRLKEGNANIAVFTKEDRVHPVDNSEGAYLLGILAAVGQTGNSLVSDVEIDANTLSVKAYNADVANVAGKDGSLSYQYEPKSLPLAADKAYLNIKNVFKYDIAGFANRENIKITNLKAGDYDVKFDGLILGTYSAEELANGINIADNLNNPSQVKAQESFNLLDKADDIFDTYVRAYIRAIEVIKNAGYDYLSDAQVRAYYGEDLNGYNYFVMLKNNYDKKHEEAISYRKQARDKCVTKSYKVTVIKK